ncbi:MAG: hypothetical protein SGBAC_009724 [Bacillariaceae sp.]
MTRLHSILYAHCIMAAIWVSSAFQSPHLSHHRQRNVLQRSELYSDPNFYNYNDNNNDNNNGGGDDTNDMTKYIFDLPMSGFWEDTNLHDELKDRRMKIHDGVGKRYIVRTLPQQASLNVHLEPSSKFDTDNIVNQLTDGQIVRSTGPTRGVWIPHDGGGWSVSDQEGFTWLEPIDE